MNKYVTNIFIFAAILAFFVFKNGWYEPSQIVLEGRADVGAAFEMRWDSGAGYNGYEKKRFSLNTVTENSDQPIDVIIQFLDERNGASLSADVTCAKITVDSTEMDLTQLQSTSGGYRHGKGVVLDKEYSKIALQAHTNAVIEIEMMTNNHSGIVELIVGGNASRHDLYVANIEAKMKVFQYWVLQENGKFKVKCDVPRYPVKSFKVHNVESQKNILFDRIKFDDRVIKNIQPALNKSPQDQLTFDISDLRSKRYVHPVQLGFQIFFAIITTWIVGALGSLYRKAGGGLEIFRGRRKFFWLFFAGAVTAYSFWLVAFWPGVMSVDSLKIWRAALLPEVFLNDHPVLNVVLYMYLSQLWQNPAVVPIAHIVLMALLTAHIFCSISNQGVPLRLLLPFYCILIFSIPIGLYNIVLWKDIPFAMLVVFWAYTLVDLYRKKIDGSVVFSKQSIVACFFLLLALGLTRHNGLVYLAVVPVYCVVLGLVDWKKFVSACAIGVVVLGGALLLLRANQSITDGSYLFVQAASYLKSMFGTSFLTLVTKTVENYWGILDINQTDSKWDLWHYFLGDRRAYWFLTHAQWNDVYPYIADSGSSLAKLREFCMQVYWLSYDSPWVYLTWNPLYVLALLPLSVVFFRKIPLTAIFSSFLFIQVFVLLFVINILNWRYYYFVCLGGMFLGPLLLLDLKRIQLRNKRLC